MWPSLTVPIWDISPFIRLQQLNHAFSALIHYGRHEAFSKLITQTQKDKSDTFETNDFPEWLSLLLKNVQAVSLDLSFIRSFDLGRTSAPKLGESIAYALKHVSDYPQWSMLESTLQSVKTWTDKLTLAQTAKQDSSKPSC